MSKPKPLKLQVWDKYIGYDIGKYKCLCCNHNFILQADFECGHILAKSKGG